MKKSNFGLFFKKPPDDYLFESMIIFCIFFWAIPIFYFPRDIKFDLSSVPAQCEVSLANHRAASAEKGKQAETFSLLVPTASLRAAQLSSAAENLQTMAAIRSRVSTCWMARLPMRST